MKTLRRRRARAALRPAWVLILAVGHGVRPRESAIEPQSAYDLDRILQLLRRARRAALAEMRQEQQAGGPVKAD